MCVSAVLVPDWCSKVKDMLEDCVLLHGMVRQKMCGVVSKYGLNIGMSPAEIQVKIIE